MTTEQFLALNRLVARSVGLVAILIIKGAVAVFFLRQLVSP